MRREGCSVMKRVLDMSVDGYKKRGKGEEKGIKKHVSAGRSWNFVSISFFYYIFGRNTR